MKRRLWITLCVLLIVISAFSWSVYVSLERAKLRKPLINSVLFGDVRYLKTLLAKGADPNARDIPDSALGIMDIIREWFAPKARKQYETYKTALYLAAERGDREATQALLDHGADINARSDSGKSALIRACTSGSFEEHEKQNAVAALLINRGADVRLSDSQGHTALFQAMEANTTKLWLPLVEHGADPNTADSNHTPILFQAIDLGSLPLMQSLLRHGANPNASCEREKPLGVAYRARREWHAEPPYTKSAAMVMLLLQHGADPNTADFQRYDNPPSDRAPTPILLHAVMDSCPDVVESLLDAGANRNMVFETQTLLMHAVMQRNLDIIRTILERGKLPPPDVNAQDTEGQTALMIAAYDGDMDIVRLLLRYRANTSLRDKENQTALSYAADSPEIATALRQHR